MMILCLLKLCVIEAMPQPLDIALRLIFAQLAEAHEGNGSRLALAWHNLFVVNHLALVSVHWRNLVRLYFGCDAVQAVHALFLFGAQTWRTLLLTSQRRNELPIPIFNDVKMFNDHVFDNLAAVAKKMLQWKPPRRRPRTPRHATQPQFDLSVSYYRCGRIKSICGDWLVFCWPIRQFHRTIKRTSRMFGLQRSASATEIQCSASKPMSFRRRCRSMPHLDFEVF